MIKGSKMSDETRAKMSESQKRRWSARRQIYLQTCNYVHIGSKRSLATRKKMSVAHKRYRAELKLNLEQIKE